MSVAQAAQRHDLSEARLREVNDIPRRASQLRAGTTLLLNGPDQPLYQAVIPGQELQEGQTQPQNVDLTSRAILYASSGEDFASAARAAAIKTRDLLNAVE